jgi:outer membrane receptor for ferrienterochelin and colicins
MGYQARQHIGFAQFLWDPPRRTGRHDLLVGASLRYVDYDDETPATATAERRFIPGVFAEDQFALTRRVTLLGGVRLDHHQSHGVIPSPRASVMYRPDAETTFRLSAGTGFRVVSLFTEDHAALTGAREVVIQEALQPERSRSLAFNLNRVFEFGANPMMVDVDVFHTEFSNRIIPDYDTNPNQIIYRNLDGQRSVSRGASLSLNQNFGSDFPLLYTLGVTVQDVFLDSPEGQVNELFAPDFRAVWNAAYTFRGLGGGDLGEVTVDYSGATTGRMRLPEFEAPFTRPTRSRVFTTHDVQLTWAWEPGRELILGVRNLTDFTQGSPLVDPGNPFGEAFDTSYFWGPVVGRRITVGARWLQSR